VEGGFDRPLNWAHRESAMPNLAPKFNCNFNLEMEIIMSKTRIRGWRQWCQALSVACLCANGLAAQAAPIEAGEPILLGQTRGNFDFIRMDTARRRLLLAHTGNKSLDVFDVEGKRLLKSVPTGAAQDCAVDARNHRYYVSVSAPPKMAIVDAIKLEVTGEVPLPAAADLMTFNPANGLAYVCNDTAPELWVIDPAAKAIVRTITLPGKGMEDLTLDPPAKHLFQVVKGNNTLTVIDPSNHQTLNSWTTVPATNPHGLALVPDADTVLVAGGNGKLALMNRSSGKMLAVADIPSRVDEMAYDPERHTAYCPGQNKIAVIAVEGEKLTVVGEVLDAPGRSIVVDSNTHTVWMASSRGGRCFVQPFAAAK
jgi:DNA-binding beta-propeller fold protein YncE